MAAKKDTTKSSSSSQASATVTRIKAKDTKTIKATPKKEKATKRATSIKEPVTEKKSRKNILKSAGGYFKGAWEELRQVRWPNRRATWSLTAAMLVFTAFFAVLILLLDALFKYLFELILG